MEDKRFLFWSIIFLCKYERGVVGVEGLVWVFGFVHCFDGCLLVKFQYFF